MSKYLMDQMATLKSEMTATIDHVKSLGRDLNEDEASVLEAQTNQFKELRAKLDRAEKARETLARLNPGTEGFGSEPGLGDGPGSKRGGSKAAGTAWAKTATDTLFKAARQQGFKSLLNGSVTVDNLVQVAAMAEASSGQASLLDIIKKEGLDSNNWSYLRQVAMTSNAAAVPDEGAKPVSIYDWEQRDERARVIAHLSQPFPIRFADDYNAILEVLDSQMRWGLFREIERLIVSGTGAGEEWTGILNTTGVGGFAFATDTLTTLRQARTSLEVRGVPVNGLALNPADAEKLDMLRENGSTGPFLFTGDVYVRLLGDKTVPIVSTAVPAGQAIMGDWSKLALRVREEGNTLAATQAGDLFSTNRMQVRCEGRYGFEFTQPAALTVVALNAPAV